MPRLVQRLPRKFEGLSWNPCKSEVLWCGPAMPSLARWETEKDRSQALAGWLAGWLVCLLKFQANERPKAEDA